MKYLLFVIVIMWCGTINAQPQPWRTKTPTECEEIFNTAGAMFPQLI